MLVAVRLMPSLVIGESDKTMILEVLRQHLLQLTQFGTPIHSKDLNSSRVYLRR
jgi:hypothetical protein